jgi:hypothetical protein
VSSLHNPGRIGGEESPLQRSSPGSSLALINVMLLEVREPVLAAVMRQLDVEDFEPENHADEMDATL